MKKSQFSSESDQDKEYSQFNGFNDQDTDESNSGVSNISGMANQMVTRKRKAPVYKDDDDYSGADSPFNTGAGSSDNEDFDDKFKNHASSQSKSKKSKRNANNLTNSKNNKKKRKYHKRAKSAADEVNDDDDIDEEDANDDEMEEEVPDDFGDTTSSSKSNSDAESDKDEQEINTPQVGSEPNKQREVPLIQEIVGVKEEDTEQTNDDEEDFQNDPNALYYVKWTGMSYIHCSYLKREQIMCISGGSSALKKYQTKINRGFRSLSQSLSIPDLMTFDDTLVSANYFEVDRVIGKRIYHYDQDVNGMHDDDNYSKFTDLEDFTNIPEVLYNPEKNQENDGKVQYYIKWRSQGYDESTWEFEDDVPSTAAIQQYEERHELVENNENEVADENRIQRQKCWNSTKIGDNRRDVDPKSFTELQDPLSDSSGNTLRDYQVEGFNWLRYCWYNGTNSILADEMGLGKTLQVTSALNDIYVNHNIHGPFFVIAPLSTLPHWKNEIERWTSMNAIIYHGNTASREIIRRYEMFDYYEPGTNVNLNASQTENESNTSAQRSEDYISKSEDNDNEDEEYDDEEYSNTNVYYKKKKTMKHSKSSSSVFTLESDPSLICDKRHVCFDVLITNYETFMMDFDLFNSIEWRYLVLDEGHRLKNHSGKCYKLLMKLKFEHCTLLTGTPVQNNVEELWSLLHFLDRSHFKDLSAFLEEYGVIEDATKLSQLQLMLKPYLLRRKKSDVDTTIAAKEETIIEVELTRAQKTYYKAFLHENSGTLLQKITGGALPSLLNLMMQLRKVCNHPFLIKGATSHIEEQVAQKLGKPVTDDEVVLKSLVESSGKLILIDKLLPKLREGGHKVLIFSQMVRVLDILEDYFSLIGIKPERIDGSVPENERQNAIERFASDPNAFVFLLCTRAGGVGINLTAADTVIIYDSDWNPQNDIQAESRCHRIGQKSKVKVYRLVTRGTYELEMLDRASKKLGLDRAILDGGTFNKKQNPMAANEIEKLLRIGAYNLSKDDTEIDEFCAENIDQILERRSKSFTRDVAEGGDSLFSKATFNANPSDLDSKDFWSALLPTMKPEDEEINSDRKCKIKQMKFNESDDEDVKKNNRRNASAASSPRGVASRIMHDGYKGSAKEKALLLYAAAEVKMNEEQEELLMKILGVSSLTEKSDDVIKAEKRFTPSLDEYTDKKDTVIFRTIFFYQLNQVMTFIQDSSIDAWPKTDTGANPLVDYALLFGIIKNGIGMQSRVMDGVVYDGTMPPLSDKMIQKVGKVVVNFFIDEAKEIEHFAKKYMEPNDWKQNHYSLFNRTVMKNDEFQLLFQTLTLTGFIEKKVPKNAQVEAQEPEQEQEQTQESLQAENQENEEKVDNNNNDDENQGQNENENEQENNNDENKNENGDAEKKSLKLRIRLKKPVNDEEEPPQNEEERELEQENEIDWSLIRKYSSLDCISLSTVIEMGQKIVALARDELSDEELDDVMSRLGQYSNKVYVSRLKSTTRDIQKIRLFTKRYKADEAEEANHEANNENQEQNENQNENENSGALGQPLEDQNQAEEGESVAPPVQGEEGEDAAAAAPAEEVTAPTRPASTYVSTFPLTPEFQRVLDKLKKMKKWDQAPSWWSTDHDLGLIKAINDYGLVYVSTWLIDPSRPFYSQIATNDIEEFTKATEMEQVKSRPQKPRDPGELAFLYNDKTRLQRAVLVIQFVDSQLQKSKRYESDYFSRDDYKSDPNYKGSIGTRSSGGSLGLGIGSRNDYEDAEMLTELPSMPLEISAQMTILDLGHFLSSADTYPVGYRVSRQYFSIKSPKEKSWYEAYTKINDDGKFRYVVKHMSEPEKEFEAHTASGVWENVIKEIENVKGKMGMPKRKFISVSGPLMFGFSHPTITSCFKLMKAQADNEDK